MAVPLLRAITAGILVVAGAGCHLGPASGSSYDVDAARACRALDSFVNDVKRRERSMPDSQALAYAMDRLKAGHGSGSRWGPLSADLTAFVTDAAGGDFGGMAKQGRLAGQECDKVPPGARVAGGFLTNRPSP
jgi:hypothetical protein